MEERAGERRRVFIGFPLRSSQGEDGELDAALLPDLPDHRRAQQGSMQVSVLAVDR